MNRFPRPLLLLALALAALTAIPGCVPERVVWSPDGSRAAVIAPDGLRLCDSSGKISPPLIPGQVQRAAWLPDGKHLVIARTVSYPTWNDIVKLGLGTTVNIEAEARAARAKFVAAAGEESSLQNPDDPRAENTARLIAIYLRDNDPSLKKDLAANWDKLADLSYDLPVAELYDLSAPEPQKQSTLFYAPLGWSLEIRPSPAAPAVAITLWNAKAEIAYTVISPTPFPPDDDVLFLGESCAYPDWSPDGKSLLFVQPPTRPASISPSPAHHGLSVPLPAAAKSADVRFGTLVRQTVIGTDGKLIEQNSHLPSEEDLAGMIYEPMGRVRAAKDGRIFFTSRDVQLPATAADLPATQSLFFIHPGKQSTVSRAAPRSVESSLGNQLSLFELSPDASFVSVPSDRGQVTVLTLATGDVQRVQPVEDHPTDGDGWTLQSVPSWRSATELTLVRPVKQGSPEREVVLHSMTDHSEKILSATWPETARKDWLTPQAP